MIMNMTFFWGGFGAANRQVDGKEKARRERRMVRMMRRFSVFMVSAPFLKCLTNSICWLRRSMYVSLEKALKVVWYFG